MSRTTQQKRSFAPVALLTVFAAGASAQEDIVTNSFENALDGDLSKSYGLRNGSFLAVPIPFSNPLIDSGLALGAGYLFQTGPGTDTSYIGVGAMGSSNDSEAAGVAIDVSLPNAWSFDAVVARADLNYDVFFGGIGVPVSQDGRLLRAGLERAVGNNFTVGAGLRFLKSTIDLTSNTPNIPDGLLPDVTGEYISLGVRLNRDTRDDSDYPTRGSLFSVEVNFADVIEGFERDYTYTFANYDTYHPLGDKAVIAGRVSACQASEEAPFFDKCSVGRTDNFRGFTPTEFFDTNMLSLQAEYRQRVWKRLGAVVFGGIGWTGGSFSKALDSDSRVAGGVGLRYQVSRRFPVDLSLDVSRNNQSEEFVYIYVGQRF